MANRTELIGNIEELIKSGEITDIESYAYARRVSRTKAVTDLRNGDWTELFIGKRGFFVKNTDKP